MRFSIVAHDRTLQDACFLNDVGWMFRGAAIHEVFDAARGIEDGADLAADGGGGIEVVVDTRDCFVNDRHFDHEDVVQAIKFTAGEEAGARLAGGGGR